MSARIWYILEVFAIVAACIASYGRGYRMGEQHGLEIAIEAIQESVDADLARVSPRLEGMKP